eukprot:m.214535 g.214535  ORF g.214535 m.214535 type:complete len:268 (+) comp33176_c6_seq19:210-1013(+)
MQAVLVTVTTLGCPRTVTRFVLCKNSKARSPTQLRNVLGLTLQMMGGQRMGVTRKTSTDTTATCCCNHLTSFTAITQETAPNARLLAVTYVFTALALVCAIIIIVFITVIEKLRQDYRYQVLLNFRLAFSMLLILILCVEDTASSGGCEAISFFMTWALISYFSWSCIEANLLYSTVEAAYNEEDSGGGREPQRSKQAILIYSRKMSWLEKIKMSWRGHCTRMPYAASRKFKSENQAKNWHRTYACTFINLPHPSNTTPIINPNDHS